MENSCPICKLKGKAIKSHMMNENQRMTVFYCRSCRYYWIDPKRLKTQHVGDYMDLLESVRTVRNINNVKILNELERLFSEKDSVKGLEVGSGNGSFLKSAKDYSRFHFIGIEPMRESYEMCTQQGLNCVQGIFPDDLPSELTGFDIIIFNDVFEHIPDSTQLLQKCAKLLQRNGLLVINCPVNTGVFFRIAKTMDSIGLSEAFKRLWQINTSSPHIHYFSERSLIRLLVGNGYELVGKPIKMAVLDKHSIAQRVHAVPMNNHQAEIFIKGLNLFFPLFRFFPVDTKCFIFRTH